MRPKGPKWLNPRSATLRPLTQTELRFRTCELDDFARKEVRQFLGAVTRSEDRATRLQGQPGFEVPGIDRVESESVDQLKHRSNRRAVIARGRHCNAARRAA